MPNDDVPSFPYVMKLYVVLIQFERTPIAVGAYIGDKNIVQSLIKVGSDVEVQDNVSSLIEHLLIFC